MSVIVILCVDHALPSGLTGMADVFSLSGLGFVHKSGSSATKKVAWSPKVVLASYDGKPIKDGHGRTIDVDTDLASIKQCDAVLIPGFIPDSQGHPPRGLTDLKTRAWLLQHSKQGALLCGSCSGVFVLGETGLLHKKKCTTTWWLHDELKQRFPCAKAAWASELIDDEGVITAGGPLSWVNITLYVIKKLAGADTANIVADFSVVDAVPKSQNLYVPEGYRAAKNPFLAKAEYSVRKAHYKTVSAVDLAKLMAVSQRTLNRKLKDLTGETPKAFIDGIRIDQACTLLTTSNKTIKDIAYSLGYSDDSVFRRLFKNKMKMSPSSYQHSRSNSR